MSTMTDRQTEALADLILEAEVRHGISMTPWRANNHRWLSTFREETRPGRGHDIDLLWIDDEKLVHISLDPYGYGHVSVADVDWTHSSADEECGCVPCAADRSAELVREAVL